MRLFKLFICSLFGSVRYVWLMFAPQECAIKCFHTHMHAYILYAHTYAHTVYYYY